MGWANCRFQQETDCQETGSGEYHLHLKDLSVVLNVPDLWKHYMTKHLVQPTEQERDFVMRANHAHVDCDHAYTCGTFGSRPREILVLYVEKKGNNYTHPIGTQPDTEFISKLEQLLAKGKRIQTRGIRLPDFEF